MLNTLPYYKSSELSPREEEVFKLILEGKSKQEIAIELCIAPSTVATHFLVIYGKKCVNSQRELMAQRIKELEETLNELNGTTNRIREENDPAFYR